MDRVSIEVSRVLTHVYGEQVETRGQTCHAQALHHSYFCDHRGARRHVVALLDRRQVFHRYHGTTAYRVRRMEAGTRNLIQHVDCVSAVVSVGPWYANAGIEVRLMIRL